MLRESVLNYATFRVVFAGNYTFENTTDQLNQLTSYFATMHLTGKLDQERAFNPRDGPPVQKQ